MLNINLLTEEQLTNPETLKAIKQEAYDLIDHFLAPESQKLAEQLEQILTATAGLENKAPEIYKQYRGLVLYLQLMALPTLDNDSVLDLIKNYFLHSINAGIDLSERMTGKMYSIPDLAWPDYAEKLIGALKQNNQRAGQQPILISGETAPQQPTIQNWIRDYDRTYGPEKQTTIQQEEYLSRNPNAQMLSEEEKFKLRNVLQFYDNLKPIPLSIIDKTFKELGIDKELGGEFSGAIPAQEFPAPSPSSEYRVHQELGQDRYLEPAEVEEIPRYKPPAPVPQSRYQPSSSSYIPPAAPPPMPPPPSPSGFGGQATQPPNVLNLKEQQYRPSSPPPPPPTTTTTPIPTSPTIPSVPTRPPSPYLEPIESIEARDVEANETPSLKPQTYTPPTIPQQPAPQPTSPPSAPPKPTPPPAQQQQVSRPPEPRLDGNIVNLKNQRIVDSDK